MVRIFYDKSDVPSSGTGYGIHLQRHLKLPATTPDGTYEFMTTIGGSYDTVGIPGNIPMSTVYLHRFIELRTTRTVSVDPIDFGTVVFEPGAVGDIIEKESNINVNGDTGDSIKVTVTPRVLMLSDGGGNTIPVNLSVEDTSLVLPSNGKALTKLKAEVDTSTPIVSQGNYSGTATITVEFN